MKTRLSPSHHGRSSAVSTLGLVSAGLLLALSLALAGCGSVSYGADDAASTTVEQAAPTSEQTVALTGNQLGDAAGASWVEAMQKLTTLLSDRPEVTTVKTQTEQLKEEYVQTLVELGRQGAVLDTGEKAKMSARIAAALEAAADEDWYATYMELYKGYAAGDSEFGDLLASFNILTQYADFDLLKKQAPKEAARLGIE